MRIREFAEKVERLCEFLLERVPVSEEREEIIKLKEAAGDLQFDSDSRENLFEGLSNHIRGVYPPEESK